MQCPRCAVLLTEIVKTGVRVDVCDQCRGMWLDRGELEQIVIRIRDLEREEAGARPVPPNNPMTAPTAAPWPTGANYPQQNPVPHGQHGDHHQHDEHHGYYQKQKGWRGLLDIFD